MTNKTSLKFLKKITECGPLTKNEKLVAESLIEKYREVIAVTIEKEKSESNIHHIFPRSRGGSNNKINRRLMNIRQHDYHHRIYNNNTPIEQLIRVLFENEKVLAEWFKKSIFSVINERGSKCYRRGVISK